MKIVALSVNDRIYCLTCAHDWNMLGELMSDYDLPFYFTCRECGQTTQTREYQLEESK